MNRCGWNAQLNKRITACSSVLDVCRIIEEQEAELNVINVATALRKVLFESRGVSRQVLDKTLQILEEHAVSKMKDFSPRHVANILHVFAKMKYRPWHTEILSCLDRRALEKG